MSKTTRVALMLPGAVSLGAYEGGALAALLTAVQAAEGQVIVDAISSASAGSITALLASRALLSGCDPVALMTRAWVELPSLERLATHDHNSPLSMNELRATATDLLGSDGVEDGAPDAYHQPVAVRLSMALTVLGGLTYRLASLRENEGGSAATTVSAQTNIDWYTKTLAPGATRSDYLSAMDGALASASTPIGFPPMLLDRSNDPDTIADYHAAGVVNDRGDWHIWYSDGGDIDNEPFGRVLDLIDETETGLDDDRVIVLLDTEPTKASWEGPWFDPDPTHVPTWTSTLRRVGHVQKNHNYYDDLRRLEKTNTRLRWVKVVADELQAGIDAGAATLSEEQRAALRSAIDEALSRAASSIEHDKQQLRAAIDPETVTGPATAPDGATTSLVEVLEQASGLHGKRKATVEIISPDIDTADTRPAPDKLAGEFLFHFGGFFDVRFRQSDFALGYRNAMTWLSTWLPDRVESVDAVMATVSTRYEQLGWDAIREGAASLHSLSLREDVRALGLVAHLAHVVEFGLRHDITGE